VADGDFRNFDLQMEVRTDSQADSGLYFHTQFQEAGWPARGYEVQINNAKGGTETSAARHRTGSLSSIRHVYKSPVADGAWFRLRVTVIGCRVRILVNDLLVVDYVQPEHPPRSGPYSRRVLSHGTVALQAHDPHHEVAIRSIRIRLLSDDTDPFAEPRPSDTPYGIAPATMDQLALQDTPLIDFHIHLRGGMTPGQAADRQALTGIGAGVLKNIGRGWPIETDEQLRQFLDEVSDMPLFAGLQVNDRDWMHRHAPELIRRLDYVLADTMIMPMPDDDSEPVKLWLADQYTIGDAETWMRRYVQHNLRVLAEPITILANPTYLPPAVADRYDELWTDERMRQVICAAVANHVALEINASSPWPHDRFIQLAKEMGARFTFGSNNFDDRPINMSRCADALQRFGLTKNDLSVPGQPW
jgi:hypothetical protein